MNEGTIKLVNARHPVLLLRGKTPVGNDMSLDGSMQALILTGPNAGLYHKYINTSYTRVGAKSVRGHASRSTALRTERQGGKEMWKYFCLCGVG